MLEEIRSRDNPLVKEMVRLGESARARRESGRFLLEGGWLETRCATASGP